MVGSNSSSGLGRFAICETLESRNLFSSGLDANFKGGLVQTRFGGTEEGAGDVVVLKDGRALASGYSSGGQFGDHSRIVLAAYNKDGTLSNRFDADGKLILSQADSDKLQGVDIEQTPDGGILLIGTTSILKLKLDGSIDTTFGKAGYATRLAEFNGYKDREVTILADGTIREVAYDGSVVRLQDESSKGQVTKSLRRTISTGAGTIDLDSTGITVATLDNKVYRFNTADLSKASGFGKGGVVDLNPYFQAWASAHGPWTGPYGDDPLPGNPEYTAGYVVNDAKNGILVEGSTNSVSENANASSPPGLGDPYTPLSFSITNNGKTVAVDSGTISGKLLAHTVYEPYPGTGSDGFDFGGTFRKTDGTTVYFSAVDDYSSNYSQTSAATRAVDGSFYVVGQYVQSDDAGHFTQRFAIAHTIVI